MRSHWAYMTAVVALTGTFVLVVSSDDNPGTDIPKATNHHQESDWRHSSRF